MRFLPNFQVKRMLTLILFVKRFCRQFITKTWRMPSMDFAKISHSLQIRFPGFSKKQNLLDCLSNFMRNSYQISEEQRLPQSTVRCPPIIWSSWTKQELRSWANPERLPSCFREHFTRSVKRSCRRLTLCVKPKFQSLLQPIATPVRLR